MSKLLKHGQGGGNKPEMEHLNRIDIGQGQVSSYAVE